jgi:hypothetical protein
VNRPLASPLLPLAGKDAFQNDLLRVLAPFFFEVVNQLNSQVQGVGADLGSGESMYLTAPLHRVTGTATIRQLEAPAGFTGPVWLLAQGAWSLSADGGNIARSVTATPGQAVVVVYDGSRWYPA